MIPTKTHGICGECRESNPYTEIYCQHCGALLPWAFLIDEESCVEPKSAIGKFVDRIFHLDREKPKHKVRCRFCDESILDDEKICPHCGRWLVAPNPMTQGGAWPAWTVDQLVNPDAPEIQRLVREYERNRVRWR